MAELVLDGLAALLLLAPDHDHVRRVENSPSRYFVFLEAGVLPDQKLRVVAADDAFLMAVLSSKAHRLFSVRLGGRHGVANTPVYDSRCFETVPFPVCAFDVSDRIRQLGEQLDAHRKSQQATHSGLTITGMYNVLADLGPTVDQALRESRFRQEIGPLPP